MSGEVFVLKDKDTLVQLEASEFSTEADFQHLLAKFPELLPGRQIDSDNPRRFMLITREQPIPDEAGGSSRWSLDHLFLDQDGIPTLVEVKRQSDTRIRREVVGQMLDYAANGVAYWPVEEIRARFEAQNDDAVQALAELLGTEADPNEFWMRVKTNLQAGRIRMLFVADQIPVELRRIVEFLNTQMDPAEVLAIEIQQYVGEGLQTLVPRVFGQTESALQKKSGTAPKRQWDEPSFFAELESYQGPEVVPVARTIAEWMKKNGKLWFGTGSKDGSMGFEFTRNGKVIVPFILWTMSRVEMTFQYLMKHAPFDDENKRKELLKLLNNIDGVALPDDAITKRKGIPLANLTAPGRVGEFLTVMGWVVNELKAA